MKDINEIMAALKTQIVAHINTYLVQANQITADNIEIDFPDVDRMRKQNMFYIIADAEHITPQTVCCDLATFNITVYIMCKKDSHSNLITKSVDFYEAFGKVIKADKTLNGNLDLIQITSAEFYPSITEDNGISGVEISLETKRNVF